LFNQPLGEKNGSTIFSIRKYILSNYDVKKKHPASFNALTFKAVTVAEATEVFEKVKRGVYRISAKEKDRRKEQEKNEKHQEVSVVSINCICHYLAVNLNILYLLYRN
jgi:hypothetical protein